MVAKYSKEVGTIGQEPRGMDLCYILVGVLWTYSQRLHPAHTFLAGSRSSCYFWTYSKYPLGISGVPLPNLINSLHINLKFDQEHLQHPFVFQQQSHLWTPLLALIYFDVIICFHITAYQICFLIIAYQVLISMLLWYNEFCKYLVSNSFVKTPKKLTHLIPSSSK